MISFRIGIIPHYITLETLILTDGIECYVSASVDELRYGLGSVCRTIAMNLAAKLFIAKTHLIEGTCGGIHHILLYHRKAAPQGICLKRHDYIYSRFTLNAIDER